MGVSVDNGPRQGLDKFLKAASDDPDTVLHYEFMQDYKVLLGLFIFQTLMTGRGNERKLLKLKHEVFYAAQVKDMLYKDMHWVIYHHFAGAPKAFGRP